MTKTLVLSLFAIACTLVVTAQPQSTDLTFTDDLVIPVLPVEDQGSTGTCWSFSTASFLEAEVKKMGGVAIDLSEMFFVRKIYVDKAEKYLRWHGKANFSEGSLGHDVVRMLKVHGALPEQVYAGLLDGRERHNHAVLVRELKKFLDDMIRSGRIANDWKDRFASILDKHLGPLPSTFSYEGESYNAKTFAETHFPFVLNDFVNLTSFQQYPYWRSIVLEIPDNYAHESYWNVPIDTLLQITIDAIEAGHSVVWDCDVSEKGFLQQEGLAIIGDNSGMQLTGNQDEIASIAGHRQTSFASYDLTDDHLMHIIGIARDQGENPYFYVKNSWGLYSGRSGYLYVSLPYFMKNTIGIMLNKDAITPNIVANMQDQHH
ncbi:MAG: aminopeptidase [Saprospiraceae bacterium]|nr:aminopeptidase [Saprospiraceae bacterium]